MVIRQNLYSVEEFKKEFSRTVIPSAIPTSEFIEWEHIEDQVERFEAQMSALEQLRDVPESVFIDGVADALMKVDDTRECIDFYFQLLGHSDTKYAAMEGLWKFHPIQRAIDGGDRETAEDIAAVLHDIGLQYLVDVTDDVAAHFRGMKVGMETHRRKNRQGDCFEAVVLEELQSICDQLREKGYDVQLVEQYHTKYQDESGQSKTVDFAILSDGEPRIVFEANCYKASGSKPSEVKRSYDRVSTRMRKDGVECVWVTDGQAWAKSLLKLLGEGYADIIDVYNIEMVRTELNDDVLNFFENGPVGTEEEIDVRAQQTLGDF